MIRCFFLQTALGRGSWKRSFWPTILHLGFNTETERERENCLCSHYSFSTMNKSSLLWAVLGKVSLKNLPSPPPVASPQKTTHLLPWMVFISKTLAVASFAAVPALGCPRIKRWDLTRRWLTSLSLATQHQQYIRCKTCAGRVEGGGCQHLRQVEYKST